jgi:hypothetical protein
VSPRSICFCKKGLNDAFEGVSPVKEKTLTEPPNVWRINPPI